MQKPPYIHRDLSWLSFNYRVLQEAKDPLVPLFERLKFLAIYSSNLDEYFRVRVANLKNLIKAGKKMRKRFDFEPQEILEQVLSTVNAQQEEFSKIFEEQIVPELENYGIHLSRYKDLSASQIEFIENYFRENLLPYVQPVVLIEDKIKPFLNNGSLYLVVEIENKEKSKFKPDMAVVKIPSDFKNRFLKLPTLEKNKNFVIILDDVIRHCQKYIFPGYKIIDSYSIKLTRDAELYIEDEFTGDLIQKIKKSLDKRNVGPASRLVFDREMSKDLLKYLLSVFDLGPYDLLPEGRYHNNFDFFKFPDFGIEGLHDGPIKPLDIPELMDGEIFKKIKEKDHLVHVPYHSYEPVIQFFEQAAEDPKVTHIKIIQYRVAKKSRIMNALMRAAQNGKQVTSFIEVKARFDEEANLEWGEKLEQAGVQVYYSIPGLKVHSKMAVVRRVEDGLGALYGYYSTGNFHEGTAKLYSDIGIFTAREEIVNEGMRIFSYLETQHEPSKDFEHLAVGRFKLKEKLIEYVKQEIKNAKAGKHASIILKMNSLQDQEMINLLYDANNAGVKIQLIVRGICCLIPGIKGFSENIECLSIIDRFLEHARIFIFHNDGDEKIFISSADWMVRNLHHRIETVVPVLQEDLRKIIKDVINIQIYDNVKARIIHNKKNNNYRKTNSELSIRSQMETYYYFRRMLDEHNYELA